MKWLLGDEFDAARWGHRALFCKFRDGKALPEPAFEKGNAILNVSFRSVPERIVAMRNEVEAFLSARAVPHETVGRIPCRVSAPSSLRA